MIRSQRSHIYIYGYHNIYIWLRFETDLYRYYPMKKKVEAILFVCNFLKKLHIFI